MTGRARHRRAVVLHWVKLAVVVCLTCAVALFFALVPFRSLLPATAIPPREEGELRLHFLRVGQGDCTIVEFPDGDALVVDAGNGSFEANNDLIRYVKGLDVSTFTYLLTHADADHFGGFSELFRVFGPGKLYLPTLTTSSNAYRRFLKAAREAGCEQDTLVRYDVISRPSGAYVACISPHATGEKDENEASTMLYVSYSGVETLLCADTSAAREEALLRELTLGEDFFDSGDFRVRLRETDIVKIAHHGSESSTSAAWLDAITPRTAIISCGEGNSYHHPAGEVLDRLGRAGTEIWRTDISGHIIASVRGGSYTIHTL